jgi:AcrR family transcriptional regulator
MPRHADPLLETRILDAAAKLWKKGGEEALTMRAIARAARTTTPTIYQRFKNREGILRALLQRIRRDAVQVLETSHSPQEACRGYIEFGMNHPHEYELFFAGAPRLLYPGRPPAMAAWLASRPGVELMRAKLAGWLGGSPQDYVRLHLAMWALTHGAAMLLISKTVPEELSPELLRACETAVTQLVEAAHGFSDPQ